MKKIWIWSLIVVCLLVLSMILDYRGVRISFLKIRPSHIVIITEIFIILFYPKSQMFMFKMKFLAPLPSDDLSLGSEKFQSYVLIEDAKFSQMFYSLSYDLDSLCFAKYEYLNVGKWYCRPWRRQLRERITKFNQENSDCLLDNTTFFLVKNCNKYLATRNSQAEHFTFHLYQHICAVF